MTDCKLLDAKAVARKLQISLQCVYRHADSGTLPCIRFGRTLRFRERDIATILDPFSDWNRRGKESKRESTDDSPNPLGECPFCGGNDAYVNIGRDHYSFCEEHKVYWYFGSNLFSSWQEQNDKDFQYSKEKLSKMTEVSGDHLTSEERKLFNSLVHDQKEGHAYVMDRSLRDLVEIAKDEEIPV